MKKIQTILFVLGFMVSINAFAFYGINIGKSIEVGKNQTICMIELRDNIEPIGNWTYNISASGEELDHPVPVLYKIHEVWKIGNQTVKEYNITKNADDQYTTIENINNTQWHQLLNQDSNPNILQVCLTNNTEGGKPNINPNELLVILKSNFIN